MLRALAHDYAGDYRSCDVTDTQVTRGSRRCDGSSLYTVCCLLVQLTPGSF